MPELPDLTIYQEALEARLIGGKLTGIQIGNPFVLRSVTPEVEEITARVVTGISRIGKRIVIDLQDDYHIIVHLMIAGRFRWLIPSAKVPRKPGLIAFDFEGGTLLLTEAGKQHPASVFFIQGNSDLSQFDQGCIDVLTCSLNEFIAALQKKNHTLKRSLTDQRFLSGIGNAYSDEILHHARISPMRQIKYLSEDEWGRLHLACQVILSNWISLLREQTGSEFPKNVTAFHPEMAAHGKYREPCPDCGKPVQRIRYASNECNYCAACQNQGNLLADRSLSRLLKKDWPKTLEELES